MAKKRTSLKNSRQGASTPNAKHKRTQQGGKMTFKKGAHSLNPGIVEKIDNTFQTYLLEVLQRCLSLTAVRLLLIYRGIIVIIVLSRCQILVFFTCFLDRIATGPHMRSRATINRLRMYKNFKPIR